MFAWNLFSRPQAFALQLSDTQIKILEVKRQAGKPTAFFSAALPSGAIEDGVIKDEGSLVEAIQKTLSKTKLRTKRVVVGLSERQSFMCRLKVDKDIPRQEMAEVVAGKAQDLLPISLEDCAFDYQVAAEADDHLEIVFAAAASDSVASYERTINQSGLKLHVLEPEACALTRALIKADTLEPEQGAAIINIENVNGMAVFADHMGIRLSAALPVFELGVTSKSAKKKPQTVTRAAKKAKALDDVQPSFAALVEEVAQGLAFCEQRYAWKQPRLFIAGDSLVAPGLFKDLAAATGLKAEEAHPIYDYPAIVSGLAMRAAGLSPGINFIVPE